MKSKYISATCLLFILMNSCVKHAGDAYHNIPEATITIYKPLLNTAINLPDSIHIQAKCISTAVIHGYDLVITKVNDTSKLYNVHVHDHNDTLLVDKKWKPSITSATDLELTLNFALDHDGNTASKKVRFRVQ